MLTFRVLTGHILYSIHCLPSDWDLFFRRQMLLDLCLSSDWARSFLCQMMLNSCLPSDWDLAFLPPPDDGRLRVAVDVTSEFYVFARQNSLVRRLLSELRPDGRKSGSRVSEDKRYPLRTASPCRLPLPPLCHIPLSPPLAASPPHLTLPPLCHLPLPPFSASLWCFFFTSI